MNLTVTDAVKDLGVTRKALSELINERSSLSSDMAVRITRATNTSSESWMNMQQKVDLWNSEHKEFNIVSFHQVDQSHSKILEG